MKEMKNIRIIISITIFIILFLITLWFAIEVYLEKKIINNNTNNTYIAEETDTTKMTKLQPQIDSAKEEDKTNNKEQESKKEKTEQIMQEYKGYTVEAKLDIPTISLETYVLKNYSTQALNISVTRFWGANANEIGNFCIAGHNFRNRMMFHNLKKLQVGDKLYITDNVNGKLQYTIYDIYIVYPKDVRCLSQDTKGKREATLITCTNDSEKRIIVKAIEDQKSMEEY